MSKTHFEYVTVWPSARKVTLYSRKKYFSNFLVRRLPVHRSTNVPTFWWAQKMWRLDFPMRWVVGGRRSCNLWRLSSPSRPHSLVEIQPEAASHLAIFCWRFQCRLPRYCPSCSLKWTKLFKPDAMRIIAEAYPWYVHPAYPSRDLHRLHRLLQSGSCIRCRPSSYSPYGTFEWVELWAYRQPEM